MSHSHNNDQEHRQYVRLHGRFPLEFSIVRLQGDLPGIDWQEATTGNISQTGICVETSRLTESVIKYFKDQNILLELRLKVPPQLPYIRAVCDVIWYKKEGSDNNPRYLIGLKFRSVQKTEIDRILFHARLFHILRSIGYVICIVLFLLLLGIAAKKHFHF